MTARQWCQRKFFKLVAEKTAAGDVDQQIDAPMLGDDLVENRFDLGFLGQVSAMEIQLTLRLAEFTDNLLARFLVHVQDDDLIIVFG